MYHLATLVRSQKKTSKSVCQPESADLTHVNIFFNP
jgi:hypothetical protein